MLRRRRGRANAKPSAKPLSSPPNAALLGVFARSKPLSLRRWDMRSPVAFASGGKVVTRLLLRRSPFCRGVRCLFTRGSQFLFLWRRRRNDWKLYYFLYKNGVFSFWKKDKKYDFDVNNNGSYSLYHVTQNAILLTHVDTKNVCLLPPIKKNFYEDYE